MANKDRTFPAVVQKGHQSQPDTVNRSEKESSVRAGMSGWPGGAPTPTGKGDARGATRSGTCGSVGIEKESTITAMSASTAMDEGQSPTAVDAARREWAVALRLILVSISPSPLE